MRFIYDAQLTHLYAMLYQSYLFDIYSPCNTPLDSAPLMDSPCSTSFHPTRPYVSSSESATHSHPSSPCSAFLCTGTPRFSASPCGSRASTADCKNSEIGLTTHRCCGYPVFLGSLNGFRVSGPSKNPRWPPPQVKASVTCEEACTR